MNELNQEKKDDANQIENKLKLLGNKTIRFQTIKKKEEPKIYQHEKIVDVKLNEGRWTYDEQIKFINLVSKYGTNWKKIKQEISTRSLSQVRSHAQKFYQRLKLCKNEGLGIDFTKDEIRSIKDMINHIKSVNNDNCDIIKILLYLTNNLKSVNNKSLDNIYNDIKDDNNCEKFNKEENKNFVNNKNKISPEILNNNIDLNNIQLLNSINNYYRLNLLSLNYFNNAIITNNYLKLIYENYLQNMSNNPIIIQQPFFYNGICPLIISNNGNNINNNINIKQFK